MNQPRQTLSLNRPWLRKHHDRPLCAENYLDTLKLTVSRYRRRYTNSTVPSFYPFRQITLNTSNHAAFGYMERR